MASLSERNACFDPHSAPPKGIVMWLPTDPVLRVLDRRRDPDPGVVHQAVETAVPEPLRDDLPRRDNGRAVGDVEHDGKEVVSALGAETVAIGRLAYRCEHEKSAAGELTRRRTPDGHR
jgi:hypothetical protein